MTPPTLGASRAGRRRKVGFALLPADDFRTCRRSDSYSGRRRRARACSTSPHEPDRIRRPRVLVRAADRAHADRGHHPAGRRARFAGRADHDALVLDARARACCCCRSSRAGAFRSPLRPPTGSWPPPSRSSTGVLIAFADSLEVVGLASRAPARKPARPPEGGHRPRPRRRLDADRRLQHPRPAADELVHLHPPPVRRSLGRGLRLACARRAGRGGRGTRGPGRG